jgi:hypothetical protein
VVTVSEIFKPTRQDGFELCHPVDGEDFATFRTLINGHPQGHSWTPIEVQFITEDRGRRLRPADAPWLGTHALIFRPSVVDALGRELRAYGELLPLACSDAELVVFNPTRLLDALDEDASSVNRFDDGSLIWIDHHVFHPEVVRGVDIFKIPNLRSSPTFVNEAFVKLWQDAGLRGLEFDPVP